jgi:hypothetical protein
MNDRKRDRGSGQPELVGQKRHRDSQQHSHLFVLLHLVCCGIPILVLVLVGSGLTLTGLVEAAPYLALAGGAITLGGLVWYLRRRRSTCAVCDIDVAKPEVRSAADDPDLRLNRDQPGEHLGNGAVGHRGREDRLTEEARRAAGMARPGGAMHTPGSARER